LTQAYERLDQITFEGAFRRNDIGVDLGLRG
jgi:phosphoribosylamine-glycine ligase